MSKSSLIIGLLVAVAAHAALFWQWPGENQDVVEAQDRNKQPPRIAVLPQLREPPPAPEPEPPVPARPKPEETVPAPAPEPPRPSRPRSEEVASPAMKEVVKAVADKAAADKKGDTSTPDGDDGLPSLRIVWESANHLRSVAASLGMKIVAVNRNNEVVGELVTDGPPRLVPFNGQLSAYSNRVRTLPIGFFRPEAASGKDVSSFWILVPADLDARFVILQKDAIRREGVSPSEVQAVEAKFQNQGRSYRLVITRVVRG